MSRSGFPFRVADQLDDDLVAYLDRMGRLFATIAQLGQLSTTATSSEIAAKVNAIISAAAQR